VFCAVLFPAPQSAPPPLLAPTEHPALPERESDLWLVPSDSDRAARTTAAYQPLSDAAARYRAGDYAGALALASRPSLADTPLADYAKYYAGLAQLRLGQAADARGTLESIVSAKPEGYIGIGAALAAGEAAEAVVDYAAAARWYERLAADQAAVSEEILTRLGRAALAAGDRRKAADAYLRVYYEFALTDAATAAAPELASLSDQLERTSYTSDLGRAQMLFGARRYTEARAAFADLQRLAEGDDKELVDLRVAECDYNQKRYAAARDGVRPYLEKAARKAEAKFFYLSAIRELGDHDEYVALARALVSEFPDSSWAEEALNNLGTHYILANEDELAAQVFREAYEKFPSGSRAERAAWKYGWYEYKTGNYAETVRVFESAAAQFPRSDYRPLYLYWASRAHGHLGAAAQADARLRLVYTDYANSYYGRLAERQLSRRAGVPPTDDRVRTPSQPPSTVAPGRPLVPTEPLIRLLLANGLYDDALNELRYAQRAWGSSAPIDATIAWAYHQKGELRRAITLMRRTYPQHLTASGQALPSDILQVIFPLAYWDSIKKQSALRGLDPYVVAALIGQESTFDPGIKSAANAWGLMQIVPATGRRLARSLGIRRFTTAMLTDPDINIRMGTLYFSRLTGQFGGAAYALASYNAGESRVVRWKAERPGLDDDEFIDDIPFPETQNYVKRILGTAEDYRLLYGEGNLSPRPVAGAPAKGKPAAVKKAPAKKPAAKTAAPKKKSSTAKKTSSTTKKPGG
jgi:soluble lytic murein transglycosylase